MIDPVDQWIADGTDRTLSEFYEWLDRRETATPTPRQRAFEDQFRLNEVLWVVAEALKPQRGEVWWYRDFATATLTWKWIGPGVRPSEVVHRIDEARLMTPDDPTKVMAGELRAFIDKVRATV